MIANVPPGICPSDDLPTNLYDADAGSAPFGGPQNPDSTIHFYGNNFALLRASNNKDHYIFFNAPTDAYIRLYMSVEPGNTIVANLFPNYNVTTNLPMYSTVVANTFDRSNIWFLPGQSIPYVLNLYYQTVGQAADCNYYALELVIKPTSTIYASLNCPNPMPDEDRQLPPEVVNVDSDFFVSSQRYMVSSWRYNDNVHDGVFTYTINFNVNRNSTIRSYIEYDFLVNEFTLVLQDGSGVNITTGIHQESPSADNSYNFMNYLQWGLRPGSYRLILADVGLKNWNLSTFCHYFGFSLSITARDSANPRIIDIEPPYGSDLDPYEPLSLDIVFSDQATVNLPTGYDLISYIIANKIVGLKDGNRTITPITASFDGTYTMLHVVFTGPFSYGQALSLAINNTYFVVRSNTSAVFQPGVAGIGHNYIMFSCGNNLCNGHGTCNKTNGVWGCSCDPTWSGSTCSQCATGYHAAGIFCVPNTYCNNSCNSNGRCSDSAGYVVCSCNRGFTGPACDTCAPGYVGYPNCTSNSTDSGEEGESCFAPLLPNDLNAPPYLSYTGKVHIQGFYYINQDTRQHDTTFTLKEQSVFRVYAEPHEIDIDLWLYLVGADGNLNVITYRITFGMEETILMILGPGNYLLRFRYYTWVVPSGDCLSFDMELAIAPLTSAQTEAQALQIYCGSTNNLPQIPSLNISGNYSFRGSGFTVNAPPYTPTPPSQANFFMRINITISPPAPNQVATLHATLGYRFLLGDLSIILESGTKGTHCANNGGLAPPPGCAHGDDLDNINTVHRFLQAGDYILWIYEPVRQISNVSTCSPFDFSLYVTFVDADEDIFNCNLPEIPSSLDSSQYNENTGFIHFHDAFILDERTMSFTVQEQSYLRAVVSAETDTSVALYDANTNALVSTNGDDQNILTILPKGRFYLKFAADIFQFCPVLYIEFALAPVSANVTANCQPSSSPNIVISQYPFRFAPNTTYPQEPRFYTRNTPSTPVVASYPFTITNVAGFDSGVQSDFLRADLRLELYRTSSPSGLIATSRHAYNYNHLLATLETGSYELRIVLPPGQTVNGFPSCAEYNFNLVIWYTTPTSPLCNGDRLPYTFNSMRFLGYEGAFNIQRSGWIIPTFLISAFQNVNFTVPKPSLIRVYTEPHNVDIDIKLLNAAGGLLVSGSNRNDEESFTYLLNANQTYIFQLQFFNPGTSQLPPCQLFNMEVEIGPVPSRPALCPNSGNIWPPAFPTSLTLPYLYNSIDINQTLWYQQISKKAVSYDMSFTLPVASNVHVEIGYDFLVGDLVLKLLSVTNNVVYYGSNKIDRNVLNLINLPAGSYVLTIAEATVNLDSVIACSGFDFFVFIDAYSSIVSTDKYLVEYHFPGTLDAIPFLNASSSVHLTNYYFMFDGTGAHDSTNFTITQQSLFRFESMLAESEVASGPRELPIVTLIGASSTVYNGSFLVTLQPGFYKLQLAPPTSLTIEDDLGVIVTVQLAITPIATLQQQLATAPQSADCPTSTFDDVLISPDGYYQDGSAAGTIAYSLLTSATEIARIPFVVDRYSVVFFQVGTQFLLNDLDLRIWTNGSSFFHGRIRKNINEIHQAIPAGTYYAQIAQPQTVIPSLGLDHCGIFSYSFIIRDATSDGTTVDCSTLNELPWQLDTNTGGSTPYGGPIGNDGTLHLYGTNMHIPPQSASYINFTVVANTFVSVLATNWPSSDLVDFTLTRAGTTVSPNQNIVSSVEKSRLTEYTAANAGQYRLGINNRGVTFGLCQFYTLQIDIAPAAVVQNAITCPSGVTGTPLPTSITLDGTGSSSNLIDSFFNGWGAVSGLTQVITFTTTNTPTTVVTLSFSYNSLITAFTMKLNQIRSPTSTVTLVTAQNRGQPTKTGQTTVYSYISTNVPPGNYTITITHPAITAPFANPTQLCAPYIFSYQIGTTVSVSDVSPPSADGVSPSDPLAITVTFSGIVYTANGGRLTSNNSTLVASAFYLTGTNGAQKYPTTAQAIDQYAFKWTLTFPPLVTSGILFTLSLAPNTLFDANQHALTIPAVFKYSTANCGVNGKYNNVTGKCDCNEGYAGSSCESCDIAHGYTAPSDKPKLCIKSACTSTTCGCFVTPAPDCKTPIGQCSTNSSGMASCKCGEAFSGAHCESCAPGYNNYPDCTNPQSCPTPCQHGTCVNLQCKCFNHFTGDACDVCPSNFAGTNCDSCASGFTGDQCNDKAGGDNSDWGATKTFLEVVAVLVSIALVAGAAFWYWRYRRAGARYKLVSRFAMDDDDDLTAHRFPDMDNRLVDDHESGHANSFHDRAPERDEEEERRVDLPRSAGSVNSEAFSGNNQSARLLDL